MASKVREKFETLQNSHITEFSTAAILNQNINCVKIMAVSTVCSAINTLLLLISCVYNVQGTFN